LKYRSMACHSKLHRVIGVVYRPRGNQRFTDALKKLYALARLGLVQEASIACFTRYSKSA
jgi:hypothetical protein